MKLIRWIWKKEKASELISYHISAMIIVLPVLAASFLFTPEQVEGRSGVASLMPKCLFKSVTGIPCPTCGMSRAFCAISHCEFRKAYEYNMLSFPLYFLFMLAGIFFPLSFTCYFFGRRRQMQENREPEKNRMTTIHN